jgi:hypothetical protein
VAIMIETNNGSTILYNIRFLAGKKKNPDLNNYKIIIFRYILRLTADLKFLSYINVGKINP